MLLSDRDIHAAIDSGALGIDPLDRSLIQPASIDLRLSEEFRVDGELVTVPWSMVIVPGGFVLGCTLEHIALDADLAGRVEGKSSWGRLGLLVHATAGFVDPGFAGQITLELYNASPTPITLHPGEPIAQLCLMPLSSPALRPYGTPGLGSRYQGQTGPTPSRVRA